MQMCHASLLIIIHHENSDNEPAWRSPGWHFNKLLELIAGLGDDLARRTIETVEDEDGGNVVAIRAVAFVAQVAAVQAEGPVLRRFPHDAGRPDAVAALRQGCAQVRGRIHLAAVAVADHAAQGATEDVAVRARQVQAHLPGWRVAELL